MPEFPIKDIGLKVGLEIHQQLATNKKLFCDCPPIELDEYTVKFQRKLRAVKSELGEYDPAALFEKSKSKTIMYYANPQNSCLVEYDEEPPHDLDEDAKKITLLIASALQSNIFSEVYPMRKIVIDGSNTTGFQRTMLVSQGGFIEAGNEKVGVQSISLEEDAARLLGDKDLIREYSLDRLGIPLVEIALEPVEGDPKKIRGIALALGRLLRSTKRVTRGIGSIRQDVNVSVKNGKVVEVKGVQHLDQLENIIEFEAKRQYGLVKIAERISDSKFGDISKKDDVFEITDKWKECKSKIVQKALKDNFRIKVIRIRDFAGMFGYTPYEGIRLGKEIGQMVKFFGVGGIFHSDELPNYGIKEEDIFIVRDLLEIKDSDAFLVIAAPRDKIDFVIESVIDRITEAKNGVPAETRLATNTGETVFLRPRPGASRMYPETDIPPIIITQDELDHARSKIPKSWDESLAELKNKYRLNQQLAEQIFDSPYLELFEKIIDSARGVNPTFVASVLCSTITNLERNGLNSQLLSGHEILKSFELLEAGKIAKESIEMVYEDIMAGKSGTIEEAIGNTAIEIINQDELEHILDKTVEDNREMIKNQKERAMGPLMGIAMKELRGKASGETVNSVLLKKIKNVLENS